MSLMTPKSLGDAGLEATWTKLLTVPGLALTSVIAILLLHSDQTQWTSSGQLYQFVGGNRAAVQIVVQVLATAFGVVHTYTLCSLTNFSTRLRLATKGYTLDRLRFWRAIGAKSLDWSMPLPFLILLLIFQLLVVIPAAIWAGALTPIDTSTTVPFSLRLPQYSQASNRYWSNLKWTSPMLSKRIGSVFTYSPNYNLQGLILDDAATATSPDNSSRIHRKLDNTGYSYTGRSYGVASSVGLADQTVNTTAVLGYQYDEPGYLSNVSCIVNATSNWTLKGPIFSPHNNVYPDLYVAAGTLTNGNPERYAACGLRGTNEIFALVGSAAHTQNVFAIAAGQNYAALNGMQCTVRFTPTVFSVVVNAIDRLIAVAPHPSSPAADAEDDVPNIEPTGAIISFAMRVPTSISQQHACDLYTSLVGSTFVQNIQTVRPDFKTAANLTGTAAAMDVLRGVEDSLAAMLDSTLLALSSAQLMIANDVFVTPTALSVRAIRIGDPTFIYIIAGINFAVVLLYLVELVRTRVWRGLGKFDHADIKSVIIGASAGGTAIAERAKRLHAEQQSWWSGDPGDTVVGKIRVGLMGDGRDIKLVGVGTEDGGEEMARDHAGGKWRHKESAPYETIPVAKDARGEEFEGYY